MLWIVLAMIAILVLAALVVTYVAYPYRGERVPKAAWVGEVMQDAVERLPTVDNRRP